VEASPEQLASAMASAEKLSEESGMQVRVIGWYHSHPHITVLPSHVDVATQASYQQLDAGFIGVIFSTFNQVRLRSIQHIISSRRVGNPDHAEFAFTCTGFSLTGDCCLHLSGLRFVRHSQTLQRVSVRVWILTFNCLRGNFTL